MVATGTKGLLVWCKQITRNYGEDVEVKNMTTSFKNGMAFCAIIHHYRPDLIDFAKLSKENVAENNELAFRIAEDELDIPALLDVEDMVVMRVPDKLSIMTYVSQYYNYFKDKIPGEIEVKKYASKKRQHAKDKIPASPAKKTNEALTNKKLLNKSAVPQQQQQQQQSRSSTCCSCGKQVFLMERLTVESKLFHRVCFKCSVCQVQLKTSTYEYDSRLDLFYCTRDYKERGKIRQQPIGEESSPRAPEHAQKNQDTPMPDASQAPLSSGDTPLKRNEQFFRRGIKPEFTRPAEMGAADKPNVIKSKAEEHNKRISPGKFSVAKLAKTQSKEPVTEKTSSDYSNPSNLKQIRSNYVNKLDSRFNALEHLVVIGAEAGSDYTEKPTSPVHMFAGVVQPDVTSTEPAGKSKQKNLIFKIKEKKGTDKDNVARSNLKNISDGQNTETAPLRSQDSRTDLIGDNYLDVRSRLRKIDQPAKSSSSINSRSSAVGAIESQEESHIISKRNQKESAHGSLNLFDGFSEDNNDKSPEVKESISSSVLSELPRPNNRMKTLVPKIKQELKVFKAPPSPTSRPNTAANNHTVVQIRPKPKKQVALKVPGPHSLASSIPARPPPPVLPLSPLLGSFSNHSPARSKKRAAPKPSQMESKGTPTEVFVPTKPPRRGASTWYDKIDTTVYANLKFPTKETTDSKAEASDTKEVEAHTEKKKAPPRPKPPKVSLNGAQVSKNILFRDKQPKREEMVCELKFLEEKQRKLEEEGVAMEKKLRDCTEGEPEDACLLKWFELVNQQNQFLRREKELIYMCQELDFLQNQRHAEFELRQLMMKNEDEKTEADKEREEELLAHFLELVNMRSNIVDKMDEERIREYEEDEKIRSMMEAKGLTSTAGTKH